MNEVQFVRLIAAMLFLMVCWSVVDAVRIAARSPIEGAVRRAQTVVRLMRAVVYAALLYVLSAWCAYEAWLAPELVSYTLVTLLVTGAMTGCYIGWVYLTVRPPV
ncbi:hypothetical protein [Burkholderia glumae]|uniref:DUF3325 domain-containing protein n=1 Tax=Burkholderia glumae TaxID=337 RepID=A0AAQ0BRV5_BURGL|nr:hypothetical protein [Burkholderia glumae]AJY64001.1 putative membrane protein [Burkholderia glumae LMG 2196 = ATCC 33617]KHJ59584.1 hypothetical protein NCPPB3923_28625 [Burkholderia glumae]MCM2484617.1 hypothetical protein [Burkholderia glumae]MCM2494997.1 hypothetical protein [Burkholderia glumae]MCM2510310.1 hypothetical protein [Burkholderia glumae]